MDLSQKCNHTDYYGPTTYDGINCFLCDEKVIFQVNGKKYQMKMVEVKDDNVDPRIIQYKIESEAAKPDLPPTDIINIRESGKYLCLNKECKNCYPDPKPKKRLRCKIGWHDYHLISNGKTTGYYQCRFCHESQGVGP